MLCGLTSGFPLTVMAPGLAEGFVIRLAATERVKKYFQDPLVKYAA